MMIGLLTIPMIQALPPQDTNPVSWRVGAQRGADRLLQVQFDDGALPWRIGDDGKFQNVQGVTAQGFLDAYRVTGNEDYLDDGHGGGAQATHTWLQRYIEDNALDGNVTRDDFVSAPNVYFLAEYALIAGDDHDLELARKVLERDLAIFDDGDASNGPPAHDLAFAILEFRKATGHDNLGLWDVALFARAAHDVGNTNVSSQFAQVLEIQTLDTHADQVVDPFDVNASSYEIGLSGLLFGLAEDDAIGHQATLRQARDALVAAQGPNGSFPNDVGEGDVQTTAYAAIGLTFVGDTTHAWEACDYIVSQQALNGGWPADGSEFAETDSEAVQALSGCVAPTRNGATSYGDILVGEL